MGSCEGQGRQMRRGAVELSIRDRAVQSRSKRLSPEGRFSRWCWPSEENSPTKEQYLLIKVKRIAISF